ncbi:alpha/beta hydrolase [Hydrocarboniclastica marina]|uniref:Alpha/beta fold hydrolase n=1 Tax=Hydrocarboniclastica marina TaxID=2259620 RepID=A0A4P7XI59_9ALTE|nr:alpha/beta fold hydrolase [Hydrocarboniclastica marina]QCF26769.1 alpha/beta fold hydrolase [Hydrocarboniclastica marina]
MRTTFEFRSGDDLCSAWLYVPDSGSAPFATVVMAHGLGGTRELRLDAFADAFCAAGYACLVFDYRHFGASGGEPRQLLDIKRQHEDWRSAIQAARNHPQLDPKRLVLWGTSMGGGHVIQIGSEDVRLAAVIAQCPFTDGISSALAVNPISSVKVTARALRDKIGSFFGKPPVMIPLAGARHGTALMTAPDAMAGYHALVPANSGFNDEVAARVALQILAYRPGLRASRVQCPILFCVCEKDTVAPPAPTLRYARTAPRGEIEVYDEGHFDIYVGKAFQRVCQQQIAFLAKHVPA